MNVVSQAKISYAYAIGNLRIKSITNSNLVTTEVRSVELLAKKTVSSENFKPNDIITYTLVIQNPGNTKVTDVVVNDDLFHQNYIEGSFNYQLMNDSNTDIVVTKNDNNLIFEIKELLPNAVLIITYKVEIDNLEEIAMDIRNIASVQSNEIKPFKTNNIDLKQRFAKIECTKKCVDYTYYNTELAYSIILKNIGNVDAIDLEVVDQLPKTFVLDSKKPVSINNNEIDIYTFDESTGILKFIVERVESNSQVEVIIKGRIVK
ncbi:MAG: DUF11 domain-containing protein [Bacilli bacterium]|nr:DUF11 domain-containing protein [Bacilli bacterium]